MPQVEASTITDPLCQLCDLTKERPYREICQVLKVESLIEEPFLPCHCVHFTCPGGLNKAETALIEAVKFGKEPINVDLVDGVSVKGFPFGTKRKPPSIGRLVTLDGWVITTDLAGNHHRSPQRVRVPSFTEDF